MTRPDPTETARRFGSSSFAWGQFAMLVVFLTIAGIASGTYVIIPFGIVVLPAGLLVSTALWRRSGKR